ncbi:MAG: hypothetical protein NTX61_16750 [Bacteroidetes bacterium]|nr:hypothetical protein [Bacteroidota bacterium]
MNNATGKLATYTAAVIALVFGSIYLLKTSFMPYHSAALSIKWEEVGRATQFLLLALMRAAAGGYISLAFAILFLQYRLSVNKLSWIPFLILILGTISMVCSLYAELIVSGNTPGRPPVLITIVCETLLIVGFIFNRKFVKTDRSANAG